MKTYSLLHGHRHGITTYIIQSKINLETCLINSTEELDQHLINIIADLDIDFEPDQEEWLEISEQTTYQYIDPRRDPENDEKILSLNPAGFSLDFLLWMHGKKADYIDKSGLAEHLWSCDVADYLSHDEPTPHELADIQTMCAQENASYFRFIELSKHILEATK